MANLFPIGNSPATWRVSALSNLCAFDGGTLDRDRFNRATRLSRWKKENARQILASRSNESRNAGDWKCFIARRDHGRVERGSRKEDKLANELYCKYRFYRDSRSNEINIPAQLPCKRRVLPAEISEKIKRNLTRLPSRSALLKETRFSVGYQRDDEVMTPKRIRRSMSVIGATIDT